jgi:hypothetical protein
MMTAFDIRKLTSLSSDARRAATSAFEALEQWRDEIVSVNERHLTKVLDLAATSQRAMGWPEQVTVGTREQLTNASKLQTDMINQVMDAWERQLKSANAGFGAGEPFKLEAWPVFGSPLMAPAPDIARLQDMAMAPMKFWIQAAEAWQHNWIDAMGSLAQPRETTRSSKSTH